MTKHKLNSCRCTECKEKNDKYLTCYIFFILGLLLGMLIIFGLSETENNQIIADDLLDNFCQLEYDESYTYEDVQLGINHRIGCTNGQVLRYIE